MAPQRCLQGRKDVLTLLAQSGHIATNAGKGDGPVIATERPGDLLLNFDHPHILLSEIVG